MTTLRLKRLDRLKKTHANKRKRNGASDSDVTVGLCPTSFSFFSVFLFCRLCRGEKLQEDPRAEGGMGQDWNKEKTRVWSSAFTSAGVIYNLQQSDTHEVHTCPAVPVDVFERANVSSLVPAGPVSLSQGGRSSEVGQELEAEAHHKVPDVSGHLGPGDENPPDDHRQDGVEGVTNVPQPGRRDGTRRWRCSR